LYSWSSLFLEIQDVLDSDQSIGDGMLIHKF